MHTLLTTSFVVNIYAVLKVGLGLIIYPIHKLRPILA